MADDLQYDVDAIQRIDAVPRILEVVCRTTGMGFAAVARVTGKRWVACAVRDDIDFGLTPGGELSVETTICDEIRQSEQAVIIDHVTADAVYCGHPTPARYGFQSYISVPIVLSDGAFFGTLCAIDPKPARINTPEIVGMFKLFAELIAAYLEATMNVASSSASLASTEARLAASNALLRDERRTSELREQFIAVLGHDLRNPLSSIAAGVRLLQRNALDTNSAGILAQMQGSVFRMSGMINNVLDFARGRLGGGVTLERSSAPLEPALRQVVDEMLTIHPKRKIETNISIRHPTMLDHTRVAQMFSNLLANALSYGDLTSPIRVRVETDEKYLAIEVANTGDPIPPEAMKKLFQPFARGTMQSNQQGLGLGLYIVSEIARAHGGTIDVESSPKETRFTVRLPLSQNLPDA